MDTYDEQHLFSKANPDPVAVTCSHIRLGSLDKTMHLKTYAKKLNTDINLQDLQKLTTKFLHVNHVLATEGTDISGFQVCKIYLSISSVLTFVQVVPCHVLQVTYDCQEMAAKKTDLIHITTSWRGSGARYDCAILQGSGPSGMVFCQVCAIFLISIKGEWYCLAVVRIYKQKQWNKITGHIELITPKARCFDLCFVNSIVRVAHILPPTSHIPCSVVQDLYDSDMYL